MKTKIATLVLVGLFCSTASAVTIQWGGNASTAKINGLTAGTSMTVGPDAQTASMTMYYFDYSDYDTIIGLGKVEASALSSYVVSQASGQTSTSANAAGRVAKSSTNTDYDTAGASFFARAYATFEDKTYFIDLFGGNGTGGVWTLSQSGDARTSETFAWTAATYGGATATAVGTKNAWVAVPEPSSAALALAGLALLLKRRKA